MSPLWIYKMAGLIKTINSGNFDTVLTTGWSKVLGSEVVFGKQSHTKLSVTFLFSYRANAIITFNTNIMINDGILTSYGQGMGTKTAYTTRDFMSVTYLVDNFSGNELRVALAVKPNAGALRIYMSNPPLIVEINEE